MYWYTLLKLGQIRSYGKHFNSVFKIKTIYPSFFFLSLFLLLISINFQLIQIIKKNFLNKQIDNISYNLLPKVYIQKIIKIRKEEDFKKIKLNLLAYNSKKKTLKYFLV